MREFVSGVVWTIERYDVDILGVTETGLPGGNFDSLFEVLLTDLKMKGVGCIWGRADSVPRNRGVMLIYRKELNVRELNWVSTESGRQLEAELTT